LLTDDFRNIVVEVLIHLAHLSIDSSKIPFQKFRSNNQRIKSKSSLIICFVKSNSKRKNIFAINLSRLYITKERFYNRIPIDFSHHQLYIHCDLIFTYILLVFFNFIQNLVTDVVDSADFTFSEVEVEDRTHYFLLVFPFFTLTKK